MWQEGNAVGQLRVVSQWWGHQREKDRKGGAAGIFQTEAALGVQGVGMWLKRKHRWGDGVVTFSHREECISMFLLRGGVFAIPVVLWHFKVGFPEITGLDPNIIELHFQVVVLLCNVYN